VPNHILETLYHNERDAPAEFIQRFEIVDVELGYANYTIGNVIAYVSIENEAQPVVL
jgi:hypothetical protein